MKGPTRQPLSSIPAKKAQIAIYGVAVTHRRVIEPAKKKDLGPNMWEGIGVDSFETKRGLSVQCPVKRQDKSTVP